MSAAVAFSGALPVFAVALITAATLGQLTSKASSSEPVEQSGLETVSDYGPALLAYARVQRNDGSYRRMLITPESLDALEHGDALPEGTRILMETYYRPDRVSTVFHKQKRGGDWLYGSFAASRPNLEVTARSSCAACHTRAAKTDSTFTLPSIWSAAAGLGPSDFACERGGRTPCGLDTYSEGAAR